MISYQLNYEQFMKLRKLACQISINKYVSENMNGKFELPDIRKRIDPRVPLEWGSVKFDNPKDLTLFLLVVA